LGGAGRSRHVHARPALLSEPGLPVCAPSPESVQAEESIPSNPSVRWHDRPKVYVPFAAALLTLFAPAFFVSATSVMCDVMLLAFYVWSMELWIRGLDQKRWWLLALAMLFVSAAVLTKYFGITLLPLLAVYTLARPTLLATIALVLLSNCRSRPLRLSEPGAVWARPFCQCG